MVLSSFGFIRVLKKSSSSSEIKDFPLVSVVIAFRNEEENISKLVNALSKQNYPSKKIEIIAIDDNSDDNSVAVAKDNISGCNFFDFKIIELGKEFQKSGKKDAIRAGVQHTNSEIILTTDADCIPSNTWIYSMVKEYTTTNSKLVCGPVMYFQSKGLLKNFFYMDFLSMAGFGAGMFGIKLPIYCNAANMLFNKDTYNKTESRVGGKQFASGDDVFLLHAIKKYFGIKNISFSLTRDSLVETEAPESFSEFFKQRIRWGGKAIGYRDIMSISTTLLIFILNFFIVILLLLRFSYSSELFVYAGLLWIIKCLFDYSILFPGAIFFKYNRLNRYYLIMQLFYPFYITIVGICSVLVNVSWKGRSN